MSKFDHFIQNLENYETILPSLKQFDINESDTRSKLIEYILINLLGWEESNLRREGKGDSGYFDYIVSLNNYSFVIEAKRINDTFALPSKGRRHKLKSIAKNNSEVIKQIRGYLIDKGLAHGVITNGEQFIIARFVNIDGTNWEDNEAIIFQSIEKIKSDATDFYNLLSKEAIEQNGRLLIKDKKPFKKCLVDHINNRNQEVYRNDFSSQLLQIIDRIFNEIGQDSEIEENQKMLVECYVPSIDIHKYAGELSGLFLDLPPVFDSKISKSKQTDHITSNIKSSLAGANSGVSGAPSPIVLIGGKGAGKTTFIRYFFNVVLNAKELKEIPSVYLDFRNYTPQEIDDTKAIYSKILNSLLIEQSYLNLSDYKTLTQIFKDEINIKTKGVWSKLSSEQIETRKIDYIEQLTSNPLEYLKAISVYLLKFQRRRLCLIFDNADQLDDDSQKGIFLLAQSLRGALGAIVFVSLREGYFYQWRSKPPFDAFHSSVYHISAPPYSSVLKKRIKYLIDKVDFTSIHSSVENKKVDFEDKTLKTLFTNLYRTLFSNVNSDIMKYLEQTTYPNIRRGLEEMNNFLVSGHTKIDSYITSQPNIPIWEFIKSIGLNNKLYYLHSHSIIYNVFYPNHDASDHFIKVRLLNFYYSFAKTNSFKEEFLSVRDIINEFSKLNYSEECLTIELESLLHNNLIISSSFSSDIEVPDKLNSDTLLRISNRGIYYTQELIYRFYYIDLVLQDTPIFDEETFKIIEEMFPKSDASGNRNLQKRVRVTEAFLDYLMKEEQAQLNRMSIDHESLALVSKVIQKNFNELDKPRIEIALYGRHT